MKPKKVQLSNGDYAWRIVINHVVNGKRHRIVRQRATKAEVKLVEDRIRGQIADGTWREDGEAPKVVTFSDYFAQWWPVYITGCESSTAYKTRGIFKNWLTPAFGAMKLTDIKPTKIQAEVLEWHATTKRAYRERFVYLNMILADAVKMELIEKNPCDPVKVPPLPPVGNPGYWRPEQIDKFFDCVDREANPEQYTLLLFSASTGMRPEEICALRVGDVDISTKTVAVKHALAYGLDGIYEKGTKSGAGKRRLPLMEDLATQLAAWLEIRGNDENAWLFPSPADWASHIGVNRPNKWFNEARDAANLKPKLSLYGLRHSFVTNALRAGVDPSAVYHLAGHASPEMVMKVYAGLNEVDAKTSVDKLANYLKGHTGGHTDPASPEKH